MKISQKKRNRNKEDNDSENEPYINTEFEPQMATTISSYNNLIQKKNRQYISSEDNKLSSTLYNTNKTRNYNLTSKSSNKKFSKTSNGL
jgi:hypothetical protein